MIIWKGLGFLGALIPVGMIVFMNSILGPDLQGWALLTSAVPLWILGRNFREQPGEMVLDPKTQRSVLVKPAHHLFWVELEYWAIIFTLLGIAALTTNLTGGISMSVGLVLSAMIFFGRLGFGFYHKYIKKEETGNRPSQQSSTSSNNKEVDSRSAFAKEIKTKRKVGGVLSKKKSTDTDIRLPESELKKKAFYAKMRKDRDTPKDFGSSDHSNYFPGRIPVRTPITEVEEEIFFEEE